MTRPFAGRGARTIVLLGLVLLGVTAVPMTAVASTSTHAPAALSDSAANSSANGGVELAAQAQATPDGNGSDGGLLSGLNPVKWAKKMAEPLIEGFFGWFFGSLADGVANLIDGFNDIILGLPAPGEYDDVSSWTDPSDGWWPGVWETYWMLAAAALSFMCIAWMWAHTQSRGEIRALYRQVGKSFLLILGGWFILPLSLHLGDALATALAPGGAEFLATPGSVSKLGLGMVLGVALLVLQAGVVLVGLFVVFAQYVLVHMVVAFWPVFCSFRAFPSSTLRSIGTVGITAHVVLIVLKVFQAAILRFLFELPWDIAQADATLTAMMGTLVGLAVSLIYLPKLAVAKILPTAMVISGGRMGSNAADAAGSAKNRARERVGSVRSGTSAGSASSGSTSTPSGGSGSRSIGSVRSRSASHSRPGGSAGSMTSKPTSGRSGMDARRRRVDDATRGIE